MLYRTRTGYFVDADPTRTDACIVSSSAGAPQTVRFYANPLNIDQIISNANYAAGVRGIGVGAGATAATAVNGFVITAPPTSGCVLMALSIIAGGNFT